jgi:cytoskeletal protein CcmA (bactofilin family)
MFSLSKKKPPPIRSLIGEGMKVRGDLSFVDGMRIDGEVHGNVIAADDGNSLLVISENARVHGRVMAAHVIINGEVLGPVHCSAMLELQPRARVTGDVCYDLLEMLPGAQVDGALSSLKTVIDKPALKLAASNDV